MLNRTNGLRYKPNSLENLRGFTRKLRKSKKRKALVTIVTMLVCYSGIVIASDSRTTNADGSIRDDAKKIDVVEFEDGQQILVAQAGNSEMGSRAVELIADYAKKAKLNHRRAGAELAQDASKELKMQLRDQFKGTAEEFQKHCEDYSFELMVAYYFEDKPQIFTLDFALGQSVTRNYSIYSIGCGKNLADYCLSGFDLSKVKFPNAMTCAIYAVEEVKKFDKNCGGPVQMGFCYPFGRSQATLHNKDSTEQVTTAVKFALAGRKDEWRKEVQGCIFEIPVDESKIKTP